MKVINKGESNTLVFTLYEKQTLPNPYWYFVFVNESSGETVAFYLTDISNYKIRSNRFTFIEGTTATLQAGVWSYYIYENETQNSASTGLCEQGQIRVKESANQIISSPNYTQQSAWTNQ